MLGFPFFGQFCAVFGPKTWVQFRSRFLGPISAPPSQGTIGGPKTRSIFGPDFGTSFWPSFPAKNDSVLEIIWSCFGARACTELSVCSGSGIFLAPFSGPHFGPHCPGPRMSTETRTKPQQRPKTHEARTKHPRTI